MIQPHSWTRPELTSPWHYNSLLWLQNCSKPPLVHSTQTDTLSQSFVMIVVSEIGECFSLFSFLFFSLFSLPRSSHFFCDSSLHWFAPDFSFDNLIMADRWSVSANQKWTGRLTKHFAFPSPCHNLCLSFRRQNVPNRCNHGNETSTINRIRRCIRQFDGHEYIECCDGKSRAGFDTCCELIPIAKRRYLPFWGC